MGKPMPSVFFLLSPKLKYCWLNDLVNRRYLDLSRAIFIMYIHMYNVHHKHLLGNKWSNKKNYKGNQKESVFIILEKLVVSNNPKVTGKSRVNYNLNFTRGKVFTLYKYARNQQ